MVKCSLPCISICAVWVSVFVHCTRVSGPTQRKRKCHHGSVKKSWAVPAYLSSWRLRWKYGCRLYLHLYLLAFALATQGVNQAYMFIGCISTQLHTYCDSIIIVNDYNRTDTSNGPIQIKGLYIDCCVVNSSLWWVSLGFWRSLLTRIL